MEALTLEDLKKDKQDLELIRAQEEQKMIDAREAMLRLEGALTYNAQCTAYLERLRSEGESAPPVKKKLKERSKGSGTCN